MLTHQTLAQISSSSYDEATFETENDTQVLIRHVDGHTVVAPRGTEKNGEDIYTDLRGYPIYDSKLGVWGHAGFRASAWEAWLQLEKLLGEYPVVFTGHSLGAAISTWFCLIMISKGRQPEQLVGFGCPGCVSPQGGRTLLASRVPTTLYRYGIDVVCLLPKFQRKIGLIKHVVPLTRVGPKDHLLRDHRIARYLSEAPTGLPQNPFGLQS